MIKFKVSYFAQIRNMSSDILPLSTTVWPPKWWTKHIDKNGVLNGLEIDELIPGHECDNLCRGPQPDVRVCNGNPDDCDFLKAYYGQLQKIDFNQLKENLEFTVNTLNEKGFKIDTVCFIVFEKYDNPCSERWIIKRWWKKNTNEELEEFNKDEYN